MSFDVSNHQVRKINGVFRTESINELVQEMAKLGVQVTLDVGLYTCDADRGAIVEVHPHGYWRGGKIGMNEGGTVIEQTLIALAIPSTAVVAGTPLSLRTTTAGKTFYMTSLVLSFDNGAQNILEVEDGSGGTEKIVRNVETVNIAMVLHNSNVPIAFTTGVFINLGATNRNVLGYMTGWEE